MTVNIADVAPASQMTKHFMGTDLKAQVSEEKGKPGRSLKNKVLKTKFTSLEEVSRKSAEANPRRQFVLTKIRR